MYAEANMGHPSREEGFALCSNFGAADLRNPVGSIFLAEKKGPTQALHPTFEQPSSLLTIGRYQQQLDLAVFRVIDVCGGSEVIGWMLVRDSRSLPAKIRPDESNAGAGKLHP